MIMRRIISITFTVFILQYSFHGAAQNAKTDARTSKAGTISSLSHWISPFAPGTANEKTPCPIMRSTFIVKGFITSGSVRIIGLGHYELYLNGKRVGKSLINQPWSQYNKTLYWEEFDVSSLLQPGENVWGVLLGNSFWHVGPANDFMRYVKTDAMPDFSGGHPVPPLARSTD